GDCSPLRRNRSKVYGLSLCRVVSFLDGIGLITEFLPGGSDLVDASRLISAIHLDVLMSVAIGGCAES
ncbi:hypothetical protein MKX03_010443, partial [Papaver bracteatum]